MMAAATVAEGASVSASPVSGAAGNVESPEAEGEGVGAAGEEKDAATRGAEAAGDSEEDGEDVFEVEKILDMKTEGVGVRRGGGAGRAGRAVRRERRGFGGRRGVHGEPSRSCALDVGGKEQDRLLPGQRAGVGGGLRLWPRARAGFGSGAPSGTLAGLRGWGREASEGRRLPQDPRRCRRASSRGRLLCSGRRLWAASHPRPGCLSSVQCSPKLWSVFCLKIHGDSRSSPESRPRGWRLEAFQV